MHFCSDIPKNIAIIGKQLIKKQTLHCTRNKVQGAMAGCCHDYSASFSSFSFLSSFAPASPSAAAGCWVKRNLCMILNNTATVQNTKEHIHTSRLARQCCLTSSALASPFSAIGSSSFVASGFFFFSSSGLAFATSFAFLALGGAYGIKNNTKHEIHLHITQRFHTALFSADNILLLPFLAVGLTLHFSVTNTFMVHITSTIDLWNSSTVLFKVFHFL